MSDEYGYGYEEDDQNEEEGHLQNEYAKLTLRVGKPHYSFAIFDSVPECLSANLANLSKGTKTQNV
jgi:hypothetical protein